MSDSEYAVRPNKSQQKRELKVLNKLGKELIELPAAKLSKIPLSEKMREAVDDGKRFSRGALQRQLRRIATLMLSEDVAEIELALQKLKQPTAQQNREFKQLEAWRDQLVAGNESVITELFEKFTNVDSQHLRQLARNAQREQQQNKTPKSARLIFKYLSSLDQKNDDQAELDPDNNHY